MEIYLKTVSEVSKNFGISTRMLRYYEQTGLLESQHREDYSYRVYDETAVRRLRQIILLRKLRIPVKQIKNILQNQDIAAAIEVFRQNIDELNGEISALSVIRDILGSLVKSLEEKINIKVTFDLLSDESVSSVIASLNLPKNHINTKEEQSMEELNQANEKLNKLTDKDVRIVYLPPATVASSHYIGDEPEIYVIKEMDKFVRDSGLLDIKPDIRNYGFNNPNPYSIDGSFKHGYEVWVTIPDDMEVHKPFIKKKFAGGLYAAHMIPMGAFEEWQWLYDWVNNNEKYEPAWGDPNCMGGCLEEFLNYRNNVLSSAGIDNIQLDLLTPIKEKT